MKKLKHMQLFETFTKINENKASKIPTKTSKKLKDKDDGKILSTIVVIGKGTYRWNSVYGVYNSIDNNEQLLKSDEKDIDWGKSREKSNEK